jgi:hypothetical protein
MPNYIKGRRLLIGLCPSIEFTRYERAQSKSCYDLRMAGPNSEVRIIQPPKPKAK